MRSHAHTKNIEAATASISHHLIRPWPARLDAGHVANHGRSEAEQE
jgi:hypothetical protein